MKRFLVVGSAVLVLSGCWDTTPFVKLTNLPGVYDVDPVEFGLYDLRVRQPLDHSDLEEGTFLQRVVIEHKGFDRPVVLVTEGYALGENHAAELAEMLGANQVRMEHRFMGDSVPEGSPWEYLTLVQSAEDAHTVVEILKPIYPGPWVNTGWSKGGQTAALHRFFHPHDVVATVAYDSPLPLAVEDERIDAHFLTVGTPECRDRMQAFQRELLEHRAELLPAFSWFAKGKGWELSLGEERVFDYTVLEFPFSFWQYSDLGCEAVPDAGDDPEKLLEFLLEISDAGWFSDASLDSPSFHQFCTELGFYGYDEAPFDGLLLDEDYPLCVFAPGWEPEDYDPAIMQKLAAWMRTDAQRVITTYGDLDPWSAPAFPVGDGLDQLQLRNPGGKHMTFIRTLGEGQRLQARTALARWLGVGIEEVAE